MKTQLLFGLLILFIAPQIFSQDPNWEFLRTDNTGIGGQVHFVVKGDQFDNIWTGGYDSTDEEGSLVRVSTDTVYTNWSTYDENYLPNGLIFDIEFDSTGIIWVGTEAGITTSGDGENWDDYDTTNSTLLADRIEAIAIDVNDQPWIVATDDNNAFGGVGYFNGTLWEYFTGATSGLPEGVAFNDIAVDANDIKWVASDAGLISYDGNVWAIYDTGNSDLSSNEVKELGIDDQNRVWAFVGNAIDIFDGTDWTQINSADWPISNFNGNSMSIRNGNAILTNGSNSRALLYDGTTWTEEILNFTIYDCFIDNDNNYWVSGYGVVGKFDGSDWTRYTRNNTGLPDNFNNDLFIDSQGRKWFANGSGGIQVFDCPNWEVYGPNNEGLFPNPQPGFQTTIGTYINEDADGDIWFTYDGTSGYVIQIPGGNYQDYNSWVIWDNTNSHPFLQFPEEVEATDDGKVFVRGSNINTLMYDKVTDTWTKWDGSNGLTSPPNCLTANGNKMYLGRYQGIDIYENGSWTQMDLSGVGIEQVRNIEFDSNGNMWIGTFDGLFMFDGTNWTTWNVDNSNIAANNITEIFIDDTTGTIYLSAHNTQIFPYYGGISYFDGTGNTFTTLLAEDTPLAHKQVEDIAVDSFGNIWAITQSEGISVYNPNGIEGFECIDRTLQRTGTLGADDFITKNELFAYAAPNPFENEITLYVNATTPEPLTVSLYDIAGREIISFEQENVVFGENKITFPVPNQQSGIYFCSISSNTSEKTIKLIKK